MADRIVGFDPDRPRMGLPPVVEDRIVEHFSPNFIPKAITNLFDIENTTFGTLAQNGDMEAHATNLTSDFIPVVGGRPYVSYYSSLSKIIWFTENKTVIAGTNTSWLGGGVTHSWVAPGNAAFVRITMSSAGFDPNITPIQFNQGTELGTGEAISTGWWDDKELPPLPEGGDAPDVDMAAVTALVQAEVDKAVPHFEPSVPTITMETVATGFHRPRWLSQDGLMLWGSYGFDLIQSTDEWKTWTKITTFTQEVEAVRELEDGELLVGVGQDRQNNINAKAYRSSGYDRDNPTAATWTEVLSAVSVNVDFKSTWGFTVAGNMVTASEYGLWGDEGSRRGWLSEDYGATWTQVFDIKTVVAEGRPTWTPNAHLHGMAWDEYWHRLWAITGDGTNAATYYSDDKGATWRFVPGSNAMQYTGIMPLPDVVVFGSDKAPNGLHVYRRGQKSDVPAIEPLFLIDDISFISRVFEFPFKRDRGPVTPTYFSASDAAYTHPTMIVGFVDGKKGHILWEGTQPGSGLPLSGNLIEVLGPTSQGSILAVMLLDPTVSGFGLRILRGVAPTWQRV